MLSDLDGMRSFNYHRYFLNKQLNFGNLTLWLCKKVTWGLTYFDEFIWCDKFITWCDDFVIWCGNFILWCNNFIIWCVNFYIYDATTLLYDLPTLLYAVTTLLYDVSTLLYGVITLLYYVSTLLYMWKLCYMMCHFIMMLWLYYDAITVLLCQNYIIMLLLYYDWSTYHMRGIKGNRRCWSPTSRKITKLQGSLAIRVRFLWKIMKMPWQHSMLGHHRPTSETTLNGVLLAGRCWPVLVMFRSTLSLKMLSEVIWTPLTKLVGFAHEEYVHTMIEGLNGGTPAIGNK